MIQIRLKSSSLFKSDFCAHFSQKKQTKKNLTRLIITMEISRTLGCDKLKKAYLLSLCLCAQKTLAETTTAEEAVQEKAFIGQVLDAITKPSAEHMSTYLGLGLALAIVAGIVLIALGGSKKENQIKFSLEDSLKED